MNLRKTFFILPNLFTLASLFCGFFAIATVAWGEHASMAQLFQAAIAIAFGFFFDLSDGRVARLTKTQSSLGLQLDSLSDLVTFGVAPALVVYRWGLDRLTATVPLGRHLGIIVCFAFVACAALRLARFNVLAIKEQDEKKSPGKYILGLTVPSSAAILVGMVMVSWQLGASFAMFGQGVVAATVLVLSYLMVSRVRFRSFKDLRLSRRTVTVMGGLVAAILLAIFWKRVPSSAVFSALMLAYVALGFFEEIIFFRRRRMEAEAARTHAPVEADGGAHSDEEVLEELGAFDDNEDEPKQAPSPPTGAHVPSLKSP